MSSTSIRPVRKAVFPVAGLGTRFLPASKAVPKEMLTIVDMPVIQYAINEAREAGIEHFVFVTGRNKHVIEDYFDHQYELEDILRAKSKNDMLEVLANQQPAPGTTSFTRQQEPRGLGHAVWCAREIIGDEPFALLLPDMLMKTHDKPCMVGMMDVYNQTGDNVVAVEECAKADVSSYGIVAPGEDYERGFEIVDMVEKPTPDESPSNLFINGRYILQPEIFDLLSNQTKGHGGEIQLTDAMIRLASDQKFSGYKFTGKSFDCGSKQGFITANIAYALENDEIGESVRNFIEDEV